MRIYKNVCTNMIKASSLGKGVRTFKVAATQVDASLRYFVQTGNRHLWVNYL